MAVIVKNLDTVRDERVLADLDAGGGAQQAIVADVGVRADGNPAGAELLDSQNAAADHARAERDAVGVAEAVHAPGIRPEQAAARDSRVRIESLPRLGGAGLGFRDIAAHEPALWPAEGGAIGESVIAVNRHPGILPTKNVRSEWTRAARR